MKEPLILKKPAEVKSQAYQTKVALPRTLASIDQELNNNFAVLKNHLEIKSSNIKHLVSEQKTNTSWFGSKLNRIGNFIVAIFDKKPLLDSLEDAQNKYDKTTTEFIKKTDTRITATKNNIDSLLAEKAQLTGNSDNSQMQRALNALVTTEKISSMLKIAELIRVQSKNNEANLSEEATLFAKEVYKEIALISANTNLQRDLNRSKAILEESIKHTKISDLQKTLMGQVISQITAVAKLSQAEETRKLIAFGQDNSILKANTLNNFLYYDFLPFAGTIAGGVLLATGVGAIGAGFIGGLIAMGVGGVIGSELIKEGLFSLNGKNKNLEHSTRSLLGAYLEGTEIGGDTIEATDVALSYGMQVGMSSLGSGSTQIAGKGIGVVLGWGLNKFGSSALAKAVLPTFTKFAENYLAKHLAAESAKTATKSAMELAHRHSARGLIKEVIEEFGEEGTEALMEQTAAHVGTQLKDQLGMSSLGISIPFVSPEAALLIAFRRSGSHGAYFKGKQDYLNQLKKVSNLFLGENGDITSNKSAEEILQTLAASNIISPEIANNLLGIPRFITATTAARELYANPNSAPTIDQEVIEYNGQDLAGNKVKYRLWTKEGWNQLGNDLSENIQYQALTILSEDPNQACVINLVVDPKLDRVETLRTFFEEQYHVKRGYDGNEHHELTAKLYAEGRLKSLGFEYRTFEEIQYDVRRNYGTTSKQTRGSNNKLKYNVAASAKTTDANFDLQQAILTSPPLRTDIDPNILQQSEFEINLNKILEKALEGKITVFEIETLVAQYALWFAQKDLANCQVKFTDLEKEAFATADITGDESQIITVFNAFRAKSLPSEKFQEISLYYLARLSRVLQKLRADKMYEEEQLALSVNLKDLSLQKRFEYQRQHLREKEKSIGYSAELFMANVGLQEGSNSDDLNAPFDILPILLLRHSGMGPSTDITEYFLEPANVPKIDSRRVVLWDASKVVRSIKAIPASDRNPPYLIVELNTPNHIGTKLLRIAVAKNHIPSSAFNIDECLRSGFETDLSRFSIDNTTTAEARQTILEELAKLGSASEKRLLYQDFYAVRNNVECFQLMAEMLGRNDQERRAIFLNICFELNYDRENRAIDQFAQGIGSSKKVLREYPKPSEFEIILQEILEKARSEKITFNEIQTFIKQYLLWLEQKDSPSCKITFTALEKQAFALVDIKKDTENDPTKTLLQNLFQAYDSGAIPQETCQSTSLEQLAQIYGTIQRLRADIISSYNEQMYKWQKIRAMRLLMQRKDKPNTAHTLNLLDTASLTKDRFARGFILPFLNLLVTPANVTTDNQLMQLLANDNDEDPWELLSRTDFNSFYFSLNSFVQSARNFGFFDALERISNEIFPDTTASNSQVPAQLRRLFQFEVFYEVFQGVMPSIRGNASFRENRKYYWQSLVEHAENFWHCDLAESRLWHLVFEGDKSEIGLGPIKNNIESALLSPADSNQMNELQTQVFNFHSLLRNRYLLNDPLRPDLTLKSLKRPEIVWDKDQWRNKTTLNSQLTTIANYLKADSLQLEQRLKKKEGLIKSYLDFFQDLIAIRELYEVGRYEEAILVIRKYLKKTGAAADNAKFPDTKKATESTWIESMRKIQDAINTKRNEVREVNQLAVTSVTSDLKTSEEPKLPPTSTDARLELPASIPVVRGLDIAQFFKIVRAGQWVPDFMAFQGRVNDQSATYFAYDCTASPTVSLSFIPYNVGADEVAFPMVPTHLTVNNEAINQSGRYESVTFAKQFSSTTKGADTRRELQREINKLKEASTVSLNEQRRLLAMAQNILNEHHWNTQTAEEFIASERQKAAGTVGKAEKAIQDNYANRFEIYRLTAESRAELETISSGKQLSREQAIAFVKSQIQRFSSWPRLTADWINHLKQFESRPKLTPDFFYSEIVSTLDLAGIFSREPYHGILPVDDTLTVAVYQNLFYPLSRLALQDQITQVVGTQDISASMLTQILTSVLALSYNESITNTLIENAKPVTNTSGTFSQDKQHAAGIIYFNKDNKATKWIPGCGSHSAELQGHTRISSERVRNNFDFNADQSIAIVYQSTSAFPNPIQLEIFLDDIRRSPELQNIPIILGIQSTDGNLYLYKLKATKGQGFNEVFGEAFYHEFCTNVFTKQFNQYLTAPNTTLGIPLLDWASGVKAKFNYFLKASVTSAYPSVDSQKIQLIVDKIISKYRDEIKAIKTLEIKTEKQFNEFKNKVSKLRSLIIDDVLELASQEFFPIKEHFEPLVIPELSSMPPAWVVEKVADKNVNPHQQKIDEIADQAFKKKDTKDKLLNENKEPATKAELLAFASIWVPEAMTNTGKANFPRFREAWDQMVPKRAKIFSDLRKPPESVAEVKRILDESSSMLTELDSEKQKVCQSLQSTLASTWAEQAISSIEQKLLSPSFAIVVPLKAEIDLAISVIDSEHSALFDQYQERIAKIKETHQKLIAIQSKLRDINTISTNMSVATLGIFIENIKFARDYDKTAGVGSSLTQGIINDNATKFWEIAQNIIAQTPIAILPRTLSALEKQFKTFLETTKDEESVSTLRAGIENTIPKTRTLSLVLNNISTTKALNENFDATVLAINENTELDPDILFKMGFFDNEIAQMQNSEIKEDKEELLIKVTERTFNELENHSSQITEALSLREADAEAIKIQIDEGEEALREILGIHFLSQTISELAGAGSFDEASLIINNSLTIASNVLRRFPKDVDGIREEAFKGWAPIAFDKFKQFEISVGQNISLVLPLEDGGEAVFKLDFLEQKDKDGTFELNIPFGWTAYETGAPFFVAQGSSHGSKDWSNSITRNTKMFTAEASSKQKPKLRISLEPKVGDSQGLSTMLVFDFFELDTRHKEKPFPASSDIAGAPLTALAALINKSPFKLILLRKKGGILTFQVESEYIDVMTIK